MLRYSRSGGLLRHCRVAGEFCLQNAYALVGIYGIFPSDSRRNKPHRYVPKLEGGQCKPGGKHQNRIMVQTTGNKKGCIRFKKMHATFLSLKNTLISFSKYTT
jgi:hypothetical protein